MGTIVNSLSNFFYDFHDGEMFSMEKAARFFEKYADRERHAAYTRETYETILSSPKINETSKILIRTRKSHAETARYYNSLHGQGIAGAADSGRPRRPKTPGLVKADIYYTNRKLTDILGCHRHDTGYPQGDFFTMVLYQQEPSSTAWDGADKALERLKAVLNGRLISRETFWLNIPAREFNRELSEQEFTQLIEVIRPYFSSQKAAAQARLNSMKRGAGYLNYIMRANMENSLNGTDLARRDIILSLSDSRQAQGEPQGQPPQPGSPLYQYQVQLSQLREEAEREKQTRMDIMGKVGQIYHQKGGNLPEKHQAVVDALGKQYDQLRQASLARQERMEQLQRKIGEIKGQGEGTPNPQQPVETYKEVPGTWVQISG